MYCRWHKKKVSEIPQWKEKCERDGLYCTDCNHAGQDHGNDVSEGTKEKEEEKTSAEHPMQE